MNRNFPFFALSTSIDSASMKTPFRHGFEFLVLSFELKKKAISASWKSPNKIEKPYFVVFVQALYGKKPTVYSQ